MNHVSKRAFLKELERDNNPASALERLFPKMNASMAMRGKKSGSGKGGGTH